MLLRVEPYITYGEPNLKTVRELVYKRGYGKVNKQRLPLSSNQIIEENLGKYGVLSIEDIVHEIVTGESRRLGPRRRGDPSSSPVLPSPLPSSPSLEHRLTRHTPPSRPALQAGCQLPVAVQALEPQRRLPHPQGPAVDRGRRVGQARAVHQRPRQEVQLSASAALFVSSRLSPPCRRRRRVGGVDVCLCVAGGGSRGSSPCVQRASGCRSALRSLLSRSLALCRLESAKATCPRSHIARFHVSRLFSCSIAASLGRPPLNL